MLKREVRCQVCRTKTRRWRPVLTTQRDPRSFFVRYVERRIKVCVSCIDARAVVQKAAAKRDTVKVGAFRQILARLFPSFGFAQREQRRKAYAKLPVGSAK